MARVLILLPDRDFDPSEAAIPWRELTDRGHEVRFATPSGRMAQADPRMLRGNGLGPFKHLLMADANARAAFATMARSDAFQAPLRHEDVRIEAIDGLLLPGGHAKGMRPYLESATAQGIVASAFARDIPVGAICHGVVLAARARTSEGRSVLHGRRTTGLTRRLELTGWALTMLWLGDYYRTYPVTVEAEVRAALASPDDFLRGPMPLLRDDPAHLERGFTVRDGHYLSARWPGDVHRFASDYAAMLEPGTVESA